MKPEWRVKWRAILLGRGVISRTPFLLWGLALAAVKFNVDRVIGAVWLGHSWSLFDASFRNAYLWQILPGDWTDPRSLLLLGAAALPFLVAGVFLTLARLRSAGLRPWWVFLFFVPAVKLIFFGLLCVLPPRRMEPLSPVGPSRWGRWIPASRLGAASVAVAITGLLGTGMTWFGANLLGDYGWSLFLAAPFGLGFIATLIYSAHQPRTVAECRLVTLVAFALVGLLLLSFALEGIFCILMAAPLALLIGMVGSATAYAILAAGRSAADPPKLMCAVVLLLPLTMLVERGASLPAPLLEVTSSVEVDAPPAQVWRHVVTFSELPPPREWLFRLGVAYPMRAVIAGHGVGAVRRCEFSTGAFVEPIEVWDEPHLLKFSVTENPEPMQEWTPYRSVHPPHLEGYLESKGGQFRLVPLAGGRTRLEGTTWYHHHLWPAGYWQLWSDHIIHTIHLRVLDHVKRLAEADRLEPRKGIAP